MSPALTTGNLPHLKSLGLLKDSPHPYPGQPPISIHSSDPLGLSPVSPHACPHSLPPLVSHPFPSLTLLPVTILFHLLSVIQASFLGPSFLFDFFGSVGCTMNILYFMANIHISVSTWLLCNSSQVFMTECWKIYVVKKRAESIVTSTVESYWYWACATIIHLGRSQLMI